MENMLKKILNHFEWLGLGLLFKKTSDEEKNSDTETFITIETK